MPVPILPYSIYEPFLSSVPAKEEEAPKRRRYRELLEQALDNPPKRKEPGLGQSIAAAAVGGLGGFLNSSPVRAVHQDPTVLQGTIDSILYGKYPEEMSLYRERLKGLKDLADLESREEIDRPYKEALAEQAKERAGYYKTAGERSLGVEQERTNRALSVQDKKSEQALSLEEKRGENRRRLNYVPTREVDPEYLKERELEDQEEVDIRPYREWSMGRIRSADRDLRERVENQRNELKKLGLDRDYQISLGRLEDAKKRTEAYIQKRGETRNNFKPEVDYVRDLGRAESEYISELSSLNRRFKIGAGFDTTTPEQLDPSQKRQYFEERGNLERKLLNRKNQLERLYAKRVGKEEDEIVDYTPDHEEEISRFDQLAKEAKTPPVQKKKIGTINLRNPETLRSMQERARQLGMTLEQAIQAARERGYEVLN